MGGGLLGMMSAHYLVKSGLKIAIFDKSKLASESSWAGGGILTPLYPWRYADAINDMAFRSQKLYPSLIDELHETSGIDPQYCKSGMLIPYTDIDDLAQNWLKQHSVVNIHADADYLSLPDICQVRNPRLASALASTIKTNSVAVYDHCSVNKITSISDNCFELKTENGYFQAARVIVSAGAWSGMILDKLGLSVDIKPVRGQMLLFKGPENLLPSIILAEGKYIIPRRDGHVLVGSTMEDVGFDKRTTDEASEDLMAFVKSRCPILAEYPVVKHWSGLRPASPNGVPFIFEHPEQKGLFVNTGHFRNGVVLGPASAELVSDLLLDLPSVLNAAAYGYKRAMSDISVQNTPKYSMGTANLF